MKNPVLITAIAATLVGFGSAQAYPGKDSGKMFDALDANGDGQLTQQELSNMHEAMSRMRFDGADADNDGEIAKQEFLDNAQKRAERMFDHMDANDDGVLDADEAKPRYRGPQHAAGMDSDKSHHENGKNKGGHGPNKAEHMFEHMDNDDDGQISRDEFSQTVDRHHGDKPQNSGNAE